MFCRIKFVLPHYISYSMTTFRVYVYRNILNLFIFALYHYVCDSRRQTSKPSSHSNCNKLRDLMVSAQERRNYACESAIWQISYLPSRIMWISLYKWFYIYTLEWCSAIIWPSIKRSPVLKTLCVYRLYGWFICWSLFFVWDLVR